DYIKQEVDEGKYCGMVMLDLHKAFDTVNHPILIDKLKAIGFDKLSVSWMQSYLEGREQMVETTSFLSEAQFSAESPETLDPLFKFHETIAKATFTSIPSLLD
ncbi:hypothetical protein KUCAC02_023514, partial [Chaenocephalus aceratus]